MSTRITPWTKHGKSGWEVDFLIRFSMPVHPGALSPRTPLLNRHRQRARLSRAATTTT
jgi:hypothetical protein